MKTMLIVFAVCSLRGSSPWPVTCGPSVWLCGRSWLCVRSSRTPSSLTSRSSRTQESSSGTRASRWAGRHFSYTSSREQSVIVSVLFVLWSCLTPTIILFGRNWDILDFVLTLIFLSFGLSMWFSYYLYLYTHATHNSRLSVLGEGSKQKYNLITLKMLCFGTYMFPYWIRKHGPTKQ